MDILRRKWIQGRIAKESYRCEAVKMTIQKLNLLHQYHFVHQIGDGTFGEVIEVETGEEGTGVNLAAKIVLKTDASRGEVKLWPKFEHGNIVPLLKMIESRDAHTYTFIMPKCRAALEQAVEDIRFIANPKGLKILTFWLQNIVDGLSYLHSQDLCHLDVKCNNVLISDVGTACICDFGFIQSAKEVMKRFGSPFVYRPPEVSCDSVDLSSVDGQKYDVWTLGLVALEMFTRLSLLKSVCKDKLDRDLSTWPDHIYPRIYGILQEDEFKRLIEDASPFSELSLAMMDDIRNLITSCLNLDHRNRPPVAEIRKYGMFGGLNEYIHRNHPGDIWNKYTSPMRIRILMSVYCREKEAKNRQKHLAMDPLKESDEKCNSHNIETGQGDAQENVVRQQTELTTDVTAETVSVYCREKEAKNRQEHLAMEPLKECDEKCSSHNIETGQGDAPENIVRQQTELTTDVTAETDEVPQDEGGSNCVTETPEHLSTRQKIRLWFKDKRSKIRRLFTCVPVRKSRK